MTLIQPEVLKNTELIKGEYFTIFPLNCTKLNTLVKPIDLLSEAC